MKKINLSFILVFFLISCTFYSVPSSTRKNFTFCYNESITGIDTQINVDGFYYNKTLILNDSQLIGRYSLGDSYIFFNDGFFVQNIAPEWLYQDLDKKISTNYRYGGDWGVYIIYGDTLKAQFIEPPGLMSWDKKEIWFKIIDKNTLQPLYFKYHNPINSKEIHNYQLTHKGQETRFVNFIHLEKIPDPNKCWLKKEKWFWCNEEAYKKWRTEQKE